MTEPTTVVPSPVVPKKILANPIHCLAFGFGSGLSPWAPGTVGTLVAIPLYYLIYYLMAGLPVAVYCVLLVATFLLGVYLCGKTATDLGVHDHPGIVWDELVGFWITMLFAPPGWGWVVAGFVLFRLFDIWKPWPIRVVDRRVQGGFGIMLDDVLAGIYALLVMQLASRVLV